MWLGVWPGCGLKFSVHVLQTQEKMMGYHSKTVLASFKVSRNRYSKKQMMRRGGECAKGIKYGSNQSQEIDAAKRQRVSTSFKKEMQDIKQLSFFFSSSAKASHHLHDSPHKVGTGLLQIPDIRT